MTVNIEPTAQAARQIARQLSQLGVRPGGVLLVHSSLNALGHVGGGSETVVAGLRQAIGVEGTLLMPALSYEWVTPAQPLFDIQHTPSNVGVISEYFRRRLGTRRSLHPTHSVCSLGPLTRRLLGVHHLDHTPCGPNSPFHLLPKFQGQILMLGCGLKPNTSLHAIEELVSPPYLFGQPLTYRLRLAEGREEEKVYRQHGFAGWVQRYDRVADILDEPDLRTGLILAAETHLIEASALWAKALVQLQDRPFYFVDPASRTPGG